MRTIDVLGTALRNAFRSRLRTTLTVLAVVVGALTLSLTSGIGAGINAYVADTVASVGVEDVMTVTKTSEEAAPEEGPRPYDPDRITGTDGPGAGAPGAASTLALTPEDVTAIGEVEGVLRVEPMRTVTLDYVQHEDGERYELALSQLVPGMHVELAAGDQVDLESSTPQVVLPESYIEPLTLGSAEQAVGRDVTLAVTDATGAQTTTTAEIVGVAAAGPLTMFGAIPNDTLATDLFELQTQGAPAGQADTFASASVWFDIDASPDEATTVQDRLSEAGYTATTLEDQLGAITSVIDTIVLVLNGFAIIALLAASIGIVNTLFMAVQERTREIGLMKAMGLSSAKVFSLFSVEATVIGLLGSGLGVLGAVAIGLSVSSALSSGVLADLPGLTLVAFDPVSIATVVLGVMAVAFLAGTTPAIRAARADPITSLRYE